MQNEKSGNSWKQNLEDVNSFPSTIQNKGVLWEKLQVRIDKRPNRKNSVFYWMVAACFTLIASIALINNHTQTGSILYSSVIKNEEKSLPVKNENAVITKRITEASTQQKKHMSRLHPSAMDEKKTALINLPDSSATVINMQPLTQANISLPVVTNTNLLTLLPLKNSKKLKVVHANELGDTIEIPTDVVHNTDLHLFQLKLAQQEIYNASGIASNNNSGISFKSKKSSN